MKPAVFFDRDGTLIELVHHLVDPTLVRLLPGAARSLRELRERGHLCVLVTNQSVIGRGLLTETGLAAVHAELDRQLGSAGAALDAKYFCPVVPGTRDPTVVEHPDRKPGPGMLRRAAEDLGIDLERSCMVGDTVSDVLAGRNAGCRLSILVRTGYGTTVDGNEAFCDAVVDDVWAATQLIVRHDGAEGARGAEKELS